MKNSNPPIGFETFCRTAWPDRFARPFAKTEVGQDVASTLDLRAAARGAMTGGLHAIVLERGKGKSTLAIALTIWAAHEGIRSFPVLLCRDQAAASTATVMIYSMQGEAEKRLHRAISLYPPLPINVDFANISRPGLRDKIERPDFAVIDDPIADGADPAKIEQVISILLGTVPTLAGPGKATSGVMFGDLGLCRALQSKGWAGS